MHQSQATKWLSGTLAISVSVAIFLSVLLSAPVARAVPSFTRQTGFPCSSCHTTPPELTPLGRTFKLNGYTMTGMPTTTVQPKGKESGLNLLQTLPLSVFFDTAYTSTNKAQPGTQNGSFQFPEDVSLFVAGQWAKHVGSFVQLTYDTQDDHFTWDNTDIRYSNTTKLASKDFVWGISMNNNPGIEDLWHTTPAWGFPWVGSDFTPTPTAVAITNLSLAQDVAGVGGYAMWDNHLYLAATMYRTNHVGAAQPFTGAGSAININGAAPYWRAAWQQSTTNNYLEVGTYGMYLQSSPECFGGQAGCGTTLKDKYTDVAVDFQYDRTIPRFHNDILSIRGTYIRENSSLNSTFEHEVSDVIGHHLNTVMANAEYHFGNRYTATFGWFQTTGTRDAGLYNFDYGSQSFDCDGPCPITGSANGSPRSNGYIANVSWWPVQNIQMAAQYTGYFNFNGRSINYDGSGRNASDNNTMYVLARFVF